MGRPAPRSMATSAKTQDARERALLVQTIDRIAAAHPADEAAASALLPSTLTDVAATAGEAPLAAQLLTLPALPIVWVDGIEITQSVQDMAGTVPLVAGKATIVRAYLRFASRAVRVRGELFASRSPLGPWTRIPSAGIAALDPSRAGSSLADLQARRRNLGYSLNFRLPAALTGAGDLWLLLGRVRTTSGRRLPLFSFFPSRVTFRAPAPLRLRLVRMRYQQGTPPLVHEPTVTDQMNIESWLRRAYPVADVQMSVTTVDANPAAPFNAVDINAQLAALRAQDLATGTDGRTHYFGLVSDAGFFMRGLASGIPGTPRPSTVASGPTGSNTWGWDNDGSYGDWYTGHELGHTFGRFHAEFCGAGGGAPYPFTDGQLANADEAYEGIDIGDPALGFPMAVLPGVEWHDVMTYCSRQWLSSFTYAGIFDRLVAEDALGPGTTAGPTTAGPTPAARSGGPVAERVVHVIGVVNLTARSGRLTSVLPLPDRAAHEPVGAPDSADRRGATTELVVRVLAADGRVLHEEPAPFLPSECRLPGEDLTGLVDVVVPDVAGAAGVELVLADAVLDRYAVGSSATAARAVPAAARGARSPAASGHPVATVEWQAAGAEAHQRYVVQVSADNGATWATVAAGTMATSIALDRADFGGVDEVTVRITASTGFGDPVVTTQQVRLD